MTNKEYRQTKNKYKSMINKILQEKLNLYRKISTLNSRDQYYTQKLSELETNRIAQNISLDDKELEQSIAKQVVRELINQAK